MTNMFPKPFTRSLTLALLASVLSASVRASDPPRPWPPNQFAPVTPERIAALPTAELPAWKAYWKASQKLAGRLSGATVTEYSTSNTIAVPPIKALYSKGLRLDAPAEWYAGEEARTFADHVVTAQTPVGAWNKGNDYAQAHPQSPAIEGNVWDRGTFDNDATILEMRFLARVNAASPDNARSAVWRKSFLRGLQYCLAAQYPNGGFPQIYPLAGGYHDGVTFNDNVTVRVLELLRDLAAGQPEFAFVSAKLRLETGRRVERGIGCILATQIKAGEGRRTIWAAQYDALTLQPAAARNFEPIGLDTRISAPITAFLMSRTNPSPAIVAAVDDAVAWFRRTSIPDMKWNRFSNEAQIVVSPGAPPMWARFYELDTEKPIFGDRDRTIHYAVSEVSGERRGGYTWYGNWPTEVLEKIEAWRINRTVKQR
jgi:PelA/Pel-15E family pectate lyase